jgi:hypothetical protein
MTPRGHLDVSHLGRTAYLRSRELVHIDRAAMPRAASRCRDDGSFGGRGAARAAWAGTGLGGAAARAGPARADDGNTVRLWDPATGQPVGDPLVAHTDRVTAVAFAPAI